MKHSIRRIGPAIAPVGEGVERPFWSVMVPAYNCGDELEHTLRSVLDQDPGPRQMQIAVVDDCSAHDRAKQIAESIAPGRIEYHRHETNVGIGGNWNSCIERARGHWVHLLHQDDCVLPGFYERIKKGIDTRDDLGAAFCRCFFMDGEGWWTAIQDLERRAEGVLEDWPRRIAAAQRIQCPAIVVQRRTYEQLGGFHTDLQFVIDWEMWIRIAVHFPVWYEPHVLAAFRIHNGQETSRLAQTGQNVADFRRGIDIACEYVDSQLATVIRHEQPRFMRSLWLRCAEQMLKRGDEAGAMNQLWAAVRSDPGLALDRTMRVLYRRALKRRLLRKWGR